MPPEQPIAKSVTETVSVTADVTDKYPARISAYGPSNKWKYLVVLAVAIAGIACTLTGIGAVIGIPLVAISGVVAVSLLSNPEKPTTKSSTTTTLLRQLNKKDPQ